MTDYNEEWEQLDEKVILVQILAELQRLNQTLSDDARDAQGDADEPTTYRCRKCQTTVSADARADHARNRHKSPPGMVNEMFTAVE